MKYRLQIGGIESFFDDAHKIFIEIDKSFEIDMDFEKWETKISGFEFELPESFKNRSNQTVIFVPKKYRLDDLVFKVISNRNILTDGKIYLNTVTGISNGDYLWWKNERIRVISIDGTDKYITAERGCYGSIEQYQNSGIITKYPKVFAGQIVYLRDIHSDAILKLGIIKEEPAFKDGVFSFTCTDLFETLDMPLSYNFYLYNSDTSTYNPTYSADKLFMSDFIYYKQSTYVLRAVFTNETPVFFNFFKINSGFTGNFGTFTQESFATWKELFLFFMKINLLMVTFDNGYYEFKQVNLISDQFYPITEKNIKDYINIDESYEIEDFKGVSKLSIKAGGTEYNFLNPYANSLNLKTIMEIDLDKNKDVTIWGDFDISKYATTVFDIFGIVYGKLSIKTHRAIWNEFKVGFPYKFTDIYENSKGDIYTLQNVSSLCFCIAKSDDTVEFLMLDDTISNPIAPCILFEVFSYSAGTTQAVLRRVTTSYPLYDLLENSATSNDIEDAIQPESGYKYFETDQFIKLLRGTSAAITAYISSVDYTDLHLDNVSSALTVGHQYWVTYDIYTAVTDKQKTWIYFNRSSF